MKIKDILHLKKSHKPADSSEHVSWLERLGGDPYIGWAIILSISFITAAVLIFMAVRLFFVIGSGGIEPRNTVQLSTKRQTLDTNGLDGLMATFVERSSKTTTLEQGFSGPPDPSQ